MVNVRKFPCKSLPIFFKKDSAGRGLVAKGLSPCRTGTEYNPRWWAFTRVFVLHF